VLLHVIPSKMLLSGVGVSLHIKLVHAQTDGCKSISPVRSRLPWMCCPKASTPSRACRIWRQWYVRP
jgi:23S rRNA C2498 (ribose-2'-O)-methylase RlmM